MISLIVFLFTLLITATILGAFRKSTYYPDGSRFKASGLFKVFAAIAIALIVVVVNPLDIERIDAGHVGIKVSNVGDNRGVGKTEYVTGWVLFNSWILGYMSFLFISNTSIMRQPT